MNIQNAWKDVYRANRMVNALNFDRDGDELYIRGYVSKHFQHALDYVNSSAHDKLANKTPGSILLKQQYKRDPNSHNYLGFIINCRCMPSFMVTDNEPQ